jgi:hypothetical protein
MQMVSSVSAMLPVIVSASLLLIFYCIYRLNTEVLDLRAGLQRAVEQLATTPPQDSADNVTAKTPLAPVVVDEPRTDEQSADHM